VTAFRSYIAQLPRDRTPITLTRAAVLLEQVLP
jgi:hypothetical protein